MNGTLLELPYLPNIKWMSCFLQSQNVCIERHENFVKSTYRNRCEIAGPNGRQVLSIPLSGGRDTHRLYTQVQMQTDARWRKIHWQSIRSAYGRSPFFEYYSQPFEAQFLNTQTSLFEFNYGLLCTMLRLLKCNNPILFTSSYEPNPSELCDYRLIEPAQPVEVLRYYQVFEDRNGFMANLSGIDLLFNMGPAAKDYLLKLK